MAGLRGTAAPSMRDVSDTASAFQAYVDSLDESKKGNVDPSNPKHAPLVQTVLSAIQSGALNQEGAAKLMRMNKDLAPLIAVTMDQSSRSPDKIQRQILGQYFSPELPGTPGNTDYDTPGADENMGFDVQRRDATPAKMDYQNAIAAANRAGLVDLSDKLSKQQETIAGKKGTFNSLDSAYASLGIDDPRKATPEQHKKALALFQPPVVLTTVGPGGAEQQVVTPRGQAVGTVTPTGKNYYKQDIQEYAKALEKARIPAILPAMEKIDAAVSEYDKTGEMPGVGNLKNTKVSQFVKTPQGRFIAAAVQNVFNEELRQASGTAVTEWEEQRKRVGDALALSNSADDYVKVYKELIRPRITNAVRNLRAGYGDAADIYEGRSNLNLKKFVESGTKQEDKQDRKSMESAALKALRGK